jgi:hypothetical protein
MLKTSIFYFFIKNFSIMKQLKFLMWLCCVALIGIQSRCKPDPEPVIPDPPFDPCAGRQPFKADFDIFDSYAGFLSLPTDTVSGFRFLAKAKDDYESYEWRIGSDARVFKEKSVSLTFEGQNVGQRISVRLIAKRKAAMMCLKNDNGIDTITKSFVVVVAPDADEYRVYGTNYVQAIFGTWEGAALDEPNKVFKIKLVNLGYWETGRHRGGRMYNFPIGAGGLRPEICGGDSINPIFYAPLLQMTHNTFRRADSTTTSSGECLPSYTAYGRLDSSDKNRLIMDFQMTRKDGTLGRKSTFIGTRR